MTIGQGSVNVDGDTRIAVDPSQPAAQAVARSLQSSVQAATGWQWSDATADTRGTVVSLAIDDSKGASLGTEGYELRSSGTEISIVAPAPAGLFYGTQSLLQLMPTEVYAKSGSVTGSWKLPEVSISDKPDVSYRSLMLDVSRHFFTVDEVKSVIDVMAMQKLNRFHWHLTDDEGWRIEIEKFPKLTSVGAWRGEGTQLPAREWDTAGFPVEPGTAPPAGRPVVPMEGTGRYGGFYTQQQIREVVQYASERFVEVIPEIEGPGHSEAAIVSYPELLKNPQDRSKYMSVQGYSDNVIAAERKSTYRFMEAVLDEVARLFPGQYVHIGGDEVPRGTWSDCGLCTRVAERNNLASNDEIRSLYLSRLARYVEKLGKRPLVWNEYEKVGADPGTSGVIAWESVSAGISSAEEGLETVFAPAQFTYLDLKYSLANPEIGLQWAGTTDTARTYSYAIPRDQMTDVGKRSVLGVTGALFTEVIWNEDRLQDMLLPRAAAVAELGWTPPETRSWADFASRMGSGQLDRFARLEQKYNIQPPSWRLTPNSDIELVSEFPGQTIRYSWDGEPTVDSPLYVGGFPLEAGRKLYAAVFDEEGRRGVVMSAHIA